MYRVRNFLTTYSLLLILGALIALVWANVDASSYHHPVGHPLLFNDLIGVPLHHWEEAMGIAHGAGPGEAEKVLTLHYLVNDILMAFFFAIAAKEVWEAVILNEGALRGKKAG